MPDKQLPPRPDLGWLKKAAKDRLADMRTSRPDARLFEAQLETARDYGFTSWRALKAHVDAHSLDGEIIAATVKGDTETLGRLLREHPAKIDIEGGQWSRPLLHQAAEQGHLDVVDLLVSLGADIHRRDRLDNATALHWAAGNGRKAVVDRLIDLGADIDGAGDAHEVGVIGWACALHDEHPDIALHLLERGATPTIFAAIALNRADLVRQVVAADPASVNARMSRFEQQRTALQHAIAKNKPEMVKLLLELGADVTARDMNGAPALVYVSSRTAPMIARMLIEAGADPGQRGANRFTSAVPILSVESAAASIDYYVDRLGFTLEWSWGDPVDFAGIMRDEVRIFLCQGGQGQSGTWISVFIQDVDDLYAEYQDRGATILSPPKNYPWGVREMSVGDPDSHVLRMGSDPV